MLELALPLLKVNLGISKENRDAYLTAIIKGVIDELEDEKGIVLETENANHLMFIVDYSAWQYRGRGEGTLSRNLQRRLHNIWIHNGGVKNE